MVEKAKINEIEAGDGPYFKNHVCEILAHTDLGVLSGFLLVKFRIVGILAGGWREDVEQSGLFRMLRDVNASLRPLPAEVVPEGGVSQGQDLDEG